MSGMSGMSGMSEWDVLGLRIALYEGSGSARLGDDERFELLSALLDAGYDVTQAFCACGLPAASSSSLLILGRFDADRPAPVGETRDAARLCTADISGLGSPDVVALAARIGAELGARPPDAWKPWYPAIDYERCTNCKQCLSFCLFDVFVVNDDDRVSVANPANCKTDCPACARVCPAVAIIFPKHAEGPINGDVVREDDLRRQPVQVDLSTLADGDLRAALRARSTPARKRFALDRDQSAGEAECACQRRRIQAELGIPDHVLERLCSASESEDATEDPAEDHTQPQPPEKPGPPSAEEWGI